MVTFTVEILKRKFHFLCSDNNNTPICYCHEIIDDWDIADNPVHYILLIPILMQRNITDLIINHITMIEIKSNKNFMLS